MTQVSDKDKDKFCDDFQHIDADFKVNTDDVRRALGVKGLVEFGRDPNGLDNHAPGAKADSLKIRPFLVLGAFANALKAVSEVGTFGANKYIDNGWLQVPNGIERYSEAELRHWLDMQTGEVFDRESGLLHQAHKVWNGLAALELILRSEKQKA